jgi:hypothetical protein
MPHRSASSAFVMPSTGGMVTRHAGDPPSIRHCRRAGRPGEPLVARVRHLSDMRRLQRAVSVAALVSVALSGTVLLTRKYDRSHLAPRETPTACEEAMAAAASIPSEGRSVTSLFRVDGQCRTVAEYAVGAAKHPDALRYHEAPSGALSVLRQLCLSGTFGDEITSTPLCTDARAQGL